MSFKPTIQVIEVASDTSFFRIKDTTTVNVSTGYTSPGAIPDASQIESVRVILQLTGEDEVLIPAGLQEGNLAGGLKVNYSLRDGVHKITALVGFKPYEVEGTAAMWLTQPDVTGKLVELQGDADFDTRVLGATYLSKAGSTILHKIKSINPTTKTIELYESYQYDITGSDDEYDGEFIMFYPAITYTMVFRQAESGIVKAIANMALTKCGCDFNSTKPLLDAILLKLAAQTAFACGNYMKANQALQLLSGFVPAPTPCSTC